MAKWGEGDPRWLVEHREDGKNVNGWHWEEKDRKEWTKARLAELFSGLVLHEAPDAADGQPTLLKVERLKDLTGDVKGEVRVEEVHSTGDEDDYVYCVTAEGSGAAQDKLRALASGAAIKAKVYDTLATAIRELREQA
ncbi:hypothetical protein GPECTOR_91g553 [Gonium pectorale]|uniref:Uncharacterized protein n=1 Tax=Gonium pectorale TaxID=33097 RepID=A0A150G0M1_GONPE|nr:hypothetical protein GPECTOR_91g553 [Gonium pectorale]|eukprot:KXZ43399.1 hypothetical protein GPECTOR_91g553 [Gonium pectorale]